MTATKAAFIGLGNMGYPMAGHLAKAGYDVTVFNRTRGKADAWVAEYGGAAADTPAEAAAGAALIFTCVGNDNDLRSVALGNDGVIAGMDVGAIYGDHTTASGGLARELGAVASEQGKGFLDAPVSGGQEGAENGVLTIMVGGDEETFAIAEPAMQSYARAVTLLGPVGSGQLTKMVNQICCVGIIQGLAEGMNFARSAGLDAKKVVDVISKGAAQSWQMENRAVTMLDGKFDFGFAVDWMRKDLRIVLEEAANNGAKIPLTTMIEGFYGELQDRGEGRLDNSALIRLLDGSA
jgi:3-hydroxyisobutyrate dehydrogenase-like beta-hydroxyacid dehydrogenase